MGEQTLGVALIYGTLHVLSLHAFEWLTHGLIELLPVASLDVA